MIKFMFFKIDSFSSLIEIISKSLKIELPFFLAALFRPSKLFAAPLVPAPSSDDIFKNFENTFSDDNTEKSVSLEKKLIEYKLRKVYIFPILAILLLLIICLNFYD